MDSISKDNYEKLLLFMDETSIPTNEFRKYVLDSLNKWFGYHSANFWLFDETRHSMDPVTLNIPPKVMHEYNHYFHRTDFLHPKNTMHLTSQQRALRISDIASKKKYEESPFYQDFMARYGYYHEMVACLKNGNEIFGSLAFIRQKDEKPFDQQDIMCLELISRHVSLKMREHLNSEKNFGSVRESAIQLLTAREKEILKLVQKGYTNAKIANELFISTNTAKKHLQNIYQKLEVNNRTGLIYKIKENNRFLD